MRDYDLIIRFKSITGAKNTNEIASLLDVKQSYISKIKSEANKLSEKTAHKMYLIAGEEIAQLWGKLQEERVRKKR